MAQFVRYSSTTTSKEEDATVKEIKVTNISQSASQKDIQDFFSYCSDIQYVEPQCFYVKAANEASQGDAASLIPAEEAADEVGDDEEFFFPKSPTDPPEGEVEDDLYGAEITRRMRMGRFIQVYEIVAGESYKLAEFTLWSAQGYYTAAMAIQSCYPYDDPPRLRCHLPHILWPWWSYFKTVRYISEDGKALDPFTTRWHIFSSSIDHVIVGDGHTEVVKLLRYKSDGVITMDIPKFRITTVQRLYQILHYYDCSYMKREPNDYYLITLDAMPNWSVEYEDENHNQLTEPRRRADDDKGETEEEEEGEDGAEVDEDDQTNSEREEGEEDSDGAAYDMGDIDNNDHGDDVAGEQQEEEEELDDIALVVAEEGIDNHWKNLSENYKQEWMDFVGRLKYIRCRSMM